MKSKQIDIKGIIRGSLAFLCYISFIIILCSSINSLNLIASLIACITGVALVFLKFIDYTDNIEKLREKEKFSKKVKNKLTNISKEICRYIPIHILKVIINFLLTVWIGTPQNQELIEESIENTQIVIILISTCIIGPILEEFIFRLLPSKFIKRKIPYIIFSGVVFAAMHVINYPNPLLYIWFYMIGALYYGYRYYETKDILVPISMHIFNNLIATISILN